MKKALAATLGWLLLHAPPAGGQEPVTAIPASPSAPAAPAAPDDGAGANGDPGAAPGAATADGAETLHVNARAPGASDRNPGTAEAPLAGFGAAVAAARPLLEAGKSVVIKVHPGIYFEGGSELVFGKPGEAGRGEVEPAPVGSLTVEAVVPGEAVLCGGELADEDWRWRSGNIYSCRLKARPDVVVVDNQLLIKHQQLRLADGPPTVFIYNRERGRLMIQLAEGWDPRRLPVMVTFPGGRTLLQLSGLPRVLFKGMVFRQCAGPFALDVAGFDELELEGCKFLWNGGRSLRASGGGRLTLRQCEFEASLAGGFHIERVGEVVFRGIVSSLNGYRDREGLLEVPSPPDTVAYGEHFEAHYARHSENHSVGFRLAHFGRATLNQGFVAENRRTGMEFEAVRQGVELRGYEIMMNHAAGVAFDQVSTVLEGNTIYGNGTYQSPGIDEPFQVAVKEEEAKPPAAGIDHRWRENVIVAIAEKGWPVLVRSAPDPAGGAPVLARRFDGHRNLYFSATGKVALWMAGGGAVSDSGAGGGAGDLELDFAGWQEWTATDLDSYFGDPLLIDPESYELEFEPASPLFRREQWPVRALGD